MKQKFGWTIAYLVLGLFVCLGFGVAAANGWRAPNFHVLDGSSSGGYLKPPLFP